MGKKRPSPYSEMSRAEAQAKWDTIREPLVSAVQGDPRGSVTLATVFIGGGLKLIAGVAGVYKTAIQTQKDPGMRESMKEFGLAFEALEDAADKTGTAMWVISGVNASGSAIGDIVKAWKGVPEVARTYDVTHNPKTLSTTETTTTSYAPSPFGGSSQSPASVSSAIPWALGAAAVAAALGITVYEAEKLIEARANANARQEPSTITLYGADGSTLGVPAPYVDQYLGQGYSLQPPGHEPAPSAPQAQYDFRTRSAAPYVPSQVGPPPPSDMIPPGDPYPRIPDGDLPGFLQGTLPGGIGAAGLAASVVAARYAWRELQRRRPPEQGPPLVTGSSGGAPMDPQVAVTYRKPDGSEGKLTTSRSRLGEATAALLAAGAIVVAAVEVVGGNA